MEQEIFYVVRSDEAGYPRYLDGFTGPKIDQPVWKSDLQDIDPFTRQSDALEHAKLAGNSDVRGVVMDDEGDNVLVCGS